MSIWITLERDAYTGWNGREVPARTIVKTFEDEYEACTWFVDDSYFEQRFTRRAVWERVDE
ncbi:MAG: hypothetical protein EKK42_20210 [Pseudonocardiaceae bacterium]|nr:MAG: hypothetical protein EKK42_20210 [Pseudonocardiaceae bacterium]